MTPEGVATVAALSLEVAEVRADLAKVQRRRTRLLRRRYEIAVALVAAGLSHLDAARVCGVSNGRISQFVAKARKAGEEFPNAKPEPEWLRRANRRGEQEGLTNTPAK